MGKEITYPEWSLGCCHMGCGLCVPVCIHSRVCAFLWDTQPGVCEFLWALTRESVSSCGHSPGSLKAGQHAEPCRVLLVAVHGAGTLETVSAVAPERRDVLPVGLAVQPFPGGTELPSHASTLTRDQRTQQVTGLECRQLSGKLLIKNRYLGAASSSLALSIFALSLS